MKNVDDGLIIICSEPAAFFWGGKKKAEAFRKPKLCTTPALIQYYLLD